MKQSCSVLNNGQKENRSNVMDGTETDAGVESVEAENVGGEERERELYPPPLLVVQNGEMRQIRVRDRERERGGHRKGK